MQAVEDRGLFLIWEWDLIQDHVRSQVDVSKFSSASSISSSTSEINDESSTSDRPNSEVDTESTVTFKCIGVTREPTIQTLLQEVRDRRDDGENVPVKLCPELTISFDSRAICFQCYHGGCWKTIVYVVREIIEYVHAAINDGSVTCVEFAWVKYKVWKCAPGYYAVNHVTRRGKWSVAFKKARNTFY